MVLNLRPTNAPEPARKIKVLDKSPFDPNRKQGARKPIVPSKIRRKVFFIYVKTFASRAYLQNACLTPGLQDATFFATKAAAEEHLQLSLVFFDPEHHSRFKVGTCSMDCEDGDKKLVQPAEGKS